MSMRGRAEAIRPFQDRLLIIFLWLAEGRATRSVALQKMARYTVPLRENGRAR